MTHLSRFAGLPHLALGGLCIVHRLCQLAPERLVSILVLASIWYTIGA